MSLAIVPEAFLAFAAPQADPSPPSPGRPTRLAQARYEDIPPTAGEALIGGSTTVHGPPLTVPGGLPGQVTLNGVRYAPLESLARAVEARQYPRVLAGEDLRSLLVTGNKEKLYVLIRGATPARVQANLQKLEALDRESAQRRARGESALTFGEAASVPSVAAERVAPTLNRNGDGFAPRKAGVEAAYDGMLDGKVWVRVGDVLDLPRQGDVEFKRWADQSGN